MTAKAYRGKNNGRNKSNSKGQGFMGGLRAASVEMTFSVGLDSFVGSGEQATRVEIQVGKDRTAVDGRDPRDSSLRSE